MDFLDTIIRGRPTRWWKMHKDNLSIWDTTQLTLIISFELSMHDNLLQEVCMGKTNPYHHIEMCENQWVSGGLQS